MGEVGGGEDAPVELDVGEGALGRQRPKLGRLVLALGDHGRPPGERLELRHEVVHAVLVERVDKHLGVEREELEALAHAALARHDEVVERDPIVDREVERAPLRLEPHVREVHDVEEALVHAHADQEVVVDRVVVVVTGPGRRVVELDEAAVQALDGGVRPVDVGPQLRYRRQEARVGPARRRHVGERALDGADEVAREAERVVELGARDGASRRVEDVVEERAEVLVGEVGDVDACREGKEGESVSVALEPLRRRRDEGERRTHRCRQSTRTGPRR